MFFIEMFVPEGVLTDARRELIAERLVALEDLTEGESMHPDSAAVVRQVMHVVVHEPKTWWTADGPVDKARPRFVVRAHVPNAWRKDLSEYLVQFFTRMIAETEDDPERLYRDPFCEVHVVGVPEGGYGLRGKVMESSALIRMIGDPYRKAQEAGEVQAPEGSFYDPMCGVLVTRDEAVLLEHEGTTYGFCCKHCRQLFVEEKRQAAEASS
ncbi:YHS domain-containing protein [Actinomadura sp. WMMB 499]|uniref:YHS domain-containing protein n=1 Tax=Actinomadura sp. WMMB 499 TaxID=1219491 RepID=UPI001246A6AF|nr:YHS domain-containing protein [Actinomadura sp. WMMB 499]QFG24775.1 YHS domain-containing protein [Actinomadura sp. WMMB 499]